MVAMVYTELPIENVSGTVSYAKGFFYAEIVS